MLGCKHFKTPSSQSLAYAHLSTHKETVPRRRKNYLFAGSHERAQDAAMLYSLFSTCRLHNINPELWLTHLFENINSTPKENLQLLLPQNYNPQTKQQWRGWLKGYGLLNGFDKKTLKRFQELEHLEDDKRKTLFDLIDTYKRDAKARKAYA